MKSILNPQKPSGYAFAAAAFVLFASASVTAADPVEEIAIAKQHAELAVTADDLAAVHGHLHYVVNCLVGPHGERFYAKELNPCQDLGNGALTDIPVGDSRHVMLEKALESALTGLGMSTDEDAKKAAGDTADYLQKVQ